MATTIKLKLRDGSDNLSIPVQFVLEWMALEKEQAKERLYAFFEPLDENSLKGHDKTFLEMTINWVPINTQTGRAEGLPLTEQVRWIKLAQKLAEVDETKDGEITLSNKDIELIWERWNNPAFKINAIPQNIAEFLMEFQEATNRWFDDLEPEKKK